LPARISLGSTHAGELGATVTALGSSALLLDVEVTELAARSLDDADLVGPRVVPVEQNLSISCFQGQIRMYLVAPNIMRYATELKRTTPIMKATQEA
jgi:hypothetical protein